MSHPNHCLVKQDLFLVILIELMLTKSSDKEVQKNRNKLKPIVDTVTLLGRLGLPFRGHSRVQKLWYVTYVRISTFFGVRMILDMYTLTRTLIFSL